MESLVYLFLKTLNFEYKKKVEEKVEENRLLYHDTLKTLDYDGNETENVLWKRLFKKKTLEVINVDMSDENNENLNFLLKYLFNNDTLKVFKMWGSHNLSFTFPLSIKKNTSLKVLKLNMIYLDNENLKLLNQFLIDSPNLKKLSLSYILTFEKGTSLISEGIFSNKNLLKLTLNLNNHMENWQEFAKELEKNDCIECLNLKYSNISKKLLSKSIKNHKKLKKLKISHMKSFVENEYLIEMLEGLSNLTYLDISNNSINDEIGSKIILKLCDKNYLNQIYISDNMLGEKSSKSLRNLLKKNLEIETIILENIDFNSVFSIKKLNNNCLQKIKYDRNEDNKIERASFQYLNLSRCFRASLCFEILMEQLIDHQIQNFNFSENIIHISEKTIPYIAYNTSILSLNLSFSQLLNQDVKNLCHGLKDNKTLIELIIKFCSIEDEGCKYLGELFQGSSKIKKIDLSHNHFQDVGIKYLDYLFMKCLSICIFNQKNTFDTIRIREKVFFNYDLVYCSIKKDGISDYKDIIERNNSFIKAQLKMSSYLFLDMGFKYE